MVPIENEKRINWNAIRAEYIGGGISQRKLAKKHGIAEGTLLDRANKEGWKALRNQAASKTITEAQQKTAEAEADNATIAADLKKRLLLRLQRIEQHFPEDATEVRKGHGKDVTVFRIKDLTAAYKDLTGDIAQSDTDNALLQSLMALERGRND